MAEKKPVSETPAEGLEKTKAVKIDATVNVDPILGGISVPMDRLIILTQVAGERQRQIDKGYDAAHDDSHSQSTLIHAGYERFRMLGTYPPDEARRKALVEMAALVVAEIELPAADAAFERPGWLGREVTDDARYYNHALALTPFSRWSDADRD